MKKKTDAHNKQKSTAYANSSHSLMQMFTGCGMNSAVLSDS